MANLIRKIQKIFGDTNAQKVQVGSSITGSPIVSSDPDTLQSLPAFEGGMRAAGFTSGKYKAPPVDEFDATIFVNSYNIAYLLQKGIPEYSANQEYYTNDICRKAGTSELYISRVDNNLENALPSKKDNANWKYSSDLGRVNEVNEFTNLLISNHTDADHDILISAGRTKSKNTYDNIVIESGIIPQIDVAFNPADPPLDNSTPKGGLASALTLTANTTYYLHLLIKNDGTASAGFDTSFTASNLLNASAIAEGFIDYLPWNMVRTDASANILKFYNLKNKRVILDVPAVILNEANYAIETRVLLDCLAPRSNGNFTINIAGDTAGEDFFYIRESESSDSLPSLTNSDVVSSGGAGDRETSVTNKDVIIDESGQIASRLETVSSNLERAIVVLNSFEPNF